MSQTFSERLFTSNKLLKEGRCEDALASYNSIVDDVSHTLLDVAQDLSGLVNIKLTAIVNRSSCHSCLGNHSDALCDALRAQTLSSVDMRVDVRLAMVYCEMGEHAKAIASCLAGLANNPRNDTLRGILGRSERSLQLPLSFGEESSQDSKAVLASYQGVDSADGHDHDHDHGHWHGHGHGGAVNEASDAGHDHSHGHSRSHSHSRSDHDHGHSHGEGR